MKYQINAENKILGRVASEIAVLLRGKNSKDFLPHKDPGNFVEVSNADKIKVTGRKSEDKMYWKYSGYPGGIKGFSYKELLIKNPNRILRHAVYGMLPNNKLRRRMILRLKIIKPQS